MDIIYWLIPLTIILLVIAVLIFFWAVKNGQFNDLDSPAISILLDDDTPKPVQAKPAQSKKVKENENKQKK